MPHRILLNDHQFLQEISEGNEKAFEQLFRILAPALKPFVFRFTRCNQSSQEIIQDTFIRVWLNRDKVSELSNIKSWVFKFAANECLHYLRDKTIHEKAVHKLSESLEERSEHTSQTVQLNEIKSVIVAAIEKLSPQRKLIYQLSRSENKTIPEISEQLSLSPNTVKNSLVTSLKLIRKHLDQNGYAFLAFLFFYIKK